MTRGDIVTAAPPGDSGKPRSVLVIQAEPFAGHPSVTVLPLTTTLYDAPLLRIPVEPGPTTGLQQSSQVCVDKAVTLPRRKIGPRIGRIEAEAMRAVDEALSRFLGLA